MRNMRRIYQRPDGSLSIVTPTWNDRVVGFGRTKHTIEAEWYEWAVTFRLSPDYVNLGDVAAESLPQDRANRDKWRLKAGKVQVDVTIPDPPHPRQGLLDQIEQAASVAQLKVLMAKLVRGERT